MIKNKLAKINIEARLKVRKERKKKHAKERVRKR